MNRDHIPSIADPSSPWYQLSELRKPNVKWCEGQNNSWIIEPANTWSNLAYIIIGILLYQKRNQLKSKPLRAYAPAFITLGICSGIYHASYTFLFQILDFFGMYLLTYLMLLINLKRLKIVKNAMGSLFWGLVLGTTALTVYCDLYTSFPIQGLIFVHVLMLLGSELYLWKKRTQNYQMKYFWSGLTLIFIAASCSVADVTRTYCDPENHFVQGHAVWHVLSSIAIYCIYLHHRQFDQELI